MSIANKIKDIRLKHKLSQQELGNTLGYPKQTISYYENEDRTITLDFIIKFAQNFKINLNWLLLDVGDKHLESYETSEELHKKIVILEKENQVLKEIIDMGKK